VGRRHVDRRSDRLPTKKYIYTLLGPFAGYVSGAPAFDVYEPWQMFLVAAAAPLVAYAVYEWTQKREIDEHKLIPLFLGVGSYGILMVGLIDWGTAQSGYFGVTEGDYAFQHAEMNVLWQALGLAVCIGVGLATGYALKFVLERTTGLAVSEESRLRATTPATGRSCTIGIPRRPPASRSSSSPPRPSERQPPSRRAPG
jgi:ammonia channel protein AmtB